MTDENKADYSYKSKRDVNTFLSYLLPFLDKRRRIGVTRMESIWDILKSVDAVNPYASLTDCIDHYDRVHYTVFYTDDRKAVRFIEFPKLKLKALPLHGLPLEVNSEYVEMCRNAIDINFKSRKKNTKLGM